MKVGGQESVLEISVLFSQFLVNLNCSKEIESEKSCQRIRDLLWEVGNRETWQILRHGGGVLGKLTGSRMSRKREGLESVDKNGDSGRGDAD